MGWCHEFGPEINPGCDHPMVADAKSCRCAECGVVCTGRFSGCADVWKAGPREVSFVRPHSAAAPKAGPRTVSLVRPPSGSRRGTTPAPQPVVEAEPPTTGVPVEALRTELESVTRRLDELTRAIASQEGERRPLKTAPAPERAPAAPPPQPRATSPVEPAPQPSARRTAEAGPPVREKPRPTNGGQRPPVPAVTPLVPAVAPPDLADPEPVDLAQPLDQALVRPVRWPATGERS
jgi:hypothetical protein